MINARSIRFRLTLWYTGVLVLGLGLFTVASLYALHYAITSSKRAVLVRREKRLVQFYRQSFPQQSVSTFLQAVDEFARPAAPYDWLQVFDEQNAQLYPEPGSSRTLILADRKLCALPCFSSVNVDGVHLAVMKVAFDVSPRRRINVYMSGSLEEHMDIVYQYCVSLFIVLPLLCLFSIPLGYAVSRRALQPVDELTEHSLKISIGNLSQRLPVPNTGDELQRLAEGWNTLLSKLDAAVERFTQFTADVSHDLRTAITVMLTTSQLALKRQRSEEEYREALATVERECQDTAQLLNDMLTLARADAYLQRIRKAPVDLAELTIGSCARVQTLAQSRTQHLTWATAGENIWVIGDRLLLQRLVGILLDNALKYTPNQGTIHVGVTRVDQRVQLSVKDTGIGIPEHLASKVFDRFVRAEAARPGQIGHGLGLAIAKWIVDAHEGEISLSSAINRGTTFTVVFPICP